MKYKFEFVRFSDSIKNWINQIQEKNIKFLFPIVGLLSLIWFLIRVIPKPSRAAYPCMRIAAPLASSFVLWLIGLSATLFSFKKTRIAFRESSYGNMAIFTLFTILSLFFTLNQGRINSFAEENTIYNIKSLPDSLKETVTPNYPIGEAKGINSGAVVWVWNPDATNENCTNEYYGNEGTPADENDDGWFLSKNNDQVAIDSMLSSGLKALSNQNTDSSAWDAIFSYFNLNKYGREEGYEDSEKIFIKINATSAWLGNINANGDHIRNQFYGLVETSPQVILSLLRQLINIYGVPQENISVGDPLKNIYNNSYNLWHDEFHDVHYVGHDGDSAGEGREPVIPTAEDIIFYSDNGEVMSSAVTDKIYTVMDEADYLINVPSMKAHALAGITTFAKNHFGSHTREDAVHLHAGLVTHQDGYPIRYDSSMYRVQVDLMGHEKLGGNQVLFLLDALWSGGEAVDPPTKWDMEPFNYDWTSSIFLSQDMVAIESVAFDFLYTEYNGEFNSHWEPKVYFPHMKGTTDYLRQAASSEYWPIGLIYDPENDGTSISSLGVNEHWNNPLDKQYTRNLGTGGGINLIFINQNTTAVDKDDDDNQPKIFTLNQNYPNPFNPSTTICFNLTQRALVKLSVYDLTGSLISTLSFEEKDAGTYNIIWNGTNHKGEKVASGSYIYTVEVNSGAYNLIQSGKMMLLK
jgi:hypothetical protein